MAAASAVTIGEVSAAPGTRAEGLLPVNHRLDDTVSGIPVIIVNGAEPGPTLLVDGCVHGDEVEGMLAVQQVCQQVDPASLRGTLIGVPALNYDAVEQMRRHTPRPLLGDAKTLDLNRAFPGDPNGTGTERIAHLYTEELLKRADYFITFHSGGNAFVGPPKVLFDDPGDELGAKNTELAKAFGWPVLWRNKGGYQFAGAATLVTRDLGIPSIVPEHGGADRLPARLNERVRINITGVRNVLYHLGMLDGTPELPDRYLTFADSSHIHVDRDGILLFEDWVDLRAKVEQGQVVGRLYDVYGAQVGEVTAPWSGEILLIRTYPVVQAGDWACSITPNAEYIDA
jgi:predicted deacylase